MEATEKRLLEEAAKKQDEHNKQMQAIQQAKMNAQSLYEQAQTSLVGLQRTDQLLEKNMASSKITFVTRQLKTADGKTPQFPSIPLIIPSNTVYNSKTNELHSIQGSYITNFFICLFLTGAKRDKLIVIDEAIQLLKSINKPVGVLSIAGPCRSGKSYVLSRLLGKSNAFDLGHTMDAKTFGIWMGTSVLECDSYVIVLLDTEGIDACTASGQEDTRIFVLTLLLSSYFIYNSKGVVNKSDLDKMK